MGKSRNRVCAGFSKTLRALAVSAVLLTALPACAAETSPVLAPALGGKSVRIKAPTIAYTAAGYSLSGAGILYDEDNASGYRALTSVEPAAGGDQPLSDVTVYPDDDTPHGFEFSYNEEEGPAYAGTISTVMVHTYIPLNP
jgi:hypothetical protein